VIADGSFAMSMEAPFIVVAELYPPKSDAARQLHRWLGVPLFTSPFGHSR